MSNYRVFPSSDETDGTAFTTEYNLSSIISKLLGNSSNGFVITDIYNPSEGKLEFNIKGYYFELSNVEAIISGETVKAGPLSFTITDTTLTATIIIMKNEGTPSYSYLLNPENPATSNDTGTQENISLVLLNKIGDNWVIPYTSRLQFSHIHIDDGEL